MPEELAKNDFVEIEYTGKVKGNGVFDTNIEAEIKKINPDAKAKIFVICLGQSMILPAIDEFLIGKSLGQYNLELPPEKAFGLRQRELIKIMPVSIFRNQNVIPQSGAVFSFDNMLGKIVAVSGGRIIVDFNNPLAGKDVVYEIKIKRKIEDEKEKVRALIQAFFNQELPFKIEDKKLRVEAGKLSQFVEMFKEKFKEILGLDLEVKAEVEQEKKEESEQKQA